jgi:gluconolactonase
MKRQRYFYVGVLIMASLLIGVSSAQESVIAPGATLERAYSGLGFGEGPACDAEGNIYFTDQPNNKILKWSTDGKVSTFMENAGRANGLYIDGKGNIIACADANNQIWQIDPKGNVTVLVKDFEGKLLNGPNDAWVHPNGGIYFTDPFYRRNYWNRPPTVQQDGEHVYYLSPDRKKLIKVTTDLNKPNGIVGTADGKTLYVADIGASKTYTYTINPDGTLSDKKLFCSAGSDGMTMDNEGNIYLTGRGVAIFNPKGERFDNIQVQEQTTNVAFGGKDRDTLFITGMRALYSIRTRVKGIENVPQTVAPAKSAPTVPGLEEDVFDTNEGKLKIVFVGHGTLMFDFAGKIVHVDPVGSQKADYSKMPKADLILITHEHPDHLNTSAIDAIKKSDTPILANKASASRVTGSIAIQNGDIKTAAGLKIEAVPMYNLTSSNHPKGNGNGYIITFGNKRVYVAGDTDNIPEMKDIKNIDIAFLPISPPFTMPAAMAAEAAKIVKPRVLYPYHYNRSDPKELVDLLKDSKDIEVRIRQLQ